MIVLDHVTKTFGPLTAVDDLSMTFDTGCTHVLLGSSGCGKSTILRLILGLETPDQGQIRIDDTLLEAASRPALVSTMGYVVQEGGLYPHLTAYRNATLAAEVRRWPAERIRRRVQELAVMVGLDDALLQRYPNQLSGGQRQRISLMRALMLDPPVLLLDEPLGALDPIVRAELQQQLLEIFTSLHKTVILVTHDVREAVVLGQMITLMTSGRIVQQGTFDDLASAPATSFVTAFLRAQLPPPTMREYL